MSTKLFLLINKDAESFVVWIHRMIHHLHTDRPKKDHVYFLKFVGAVRLHYLHEGMLAGS